MRHAYLIQSYNDFYILECLLKLIDDQRNDIYVHIDKKVKNFDFLYYKNLVKKSNIFFTKRIDVRWGTYTQIESELILFGEAFKRHYNYYHLLSGSDLIIKSQGEIHDFFKKNSGFEFICFDCHDKVKETTLDRISYYHLFTSNMRAKNKFVHKIFNSLHTRIFNVEKKLNIKRKIPFEVRKGANWVSITDGLVKYILENKKMIKKYFSKGYCADELFIQTLVYNSEFYNKVYSKKDDDYAGIKRLIDWNRGAPYTFREKDFDEIIRCDRFFARKFSTSVDKKIIDKIYNYVRND